MNIFAEKVIKISAMASMATLLACLCPSSAPALSAQYKTSIIETKVDPLLNEVLLTDKKYGVLEKELGSLNLEESKLKEILGLVGAKITYAMERKDIGYSFKQIMDDYALMTEEKKPVKERGDYIQKALREFVSSLKMPEFPAGQKDWPEEVKTVLQRYETTGQRRDDLITRLAGILEESAEPGEGKRGIGDNAERAREITEFLGGHWGGALAVSYMGGRGEAVDATVVNGMIRVTKRQNSKIKLMLEAHYFSKAWSPMENLFGCVTPNCATGPFVAFEPNGSENNLINDIGIGWLIGLKSANSKSSFNLGIGVSLEPSVRNLVDGQEENKYHPLCTGPDPKATPNYTEPSVVPITLSTCNPPVDFQDKQRISPMLMFSFAW